MAYGYVYLILNKKNNKSYIGQHKSSKLWNEDKYMGSGAALKRAKEKYGLDCFEKFLVQYCDSKEELDKQEIFWIAEYRKRNMAEYNIAKGGNSNAGYHWTEKQREAHKHRDTSFLYTEEYKQKQSKSHLGKHVHSEEWKQHLREVHKGKPFGVHKKTQDEIDRARAKMQKYYDDPEWCHKRALEVAQAKKRNGTITTKDSHGRFCKQGVEQAYVPPRGSKGMHWYTNGTDTVIAYTCPEGYVAGRILKHE